jgi:hypothetical protein
MRVGRDGQARSAQVSYQCLIFQKGNFMEPLPPKFRLCRNRYGLVRSHQNNENRLYTMNSRLRASPRHGGQEGF